jgi:hypothetical protein
VITAGWANPEKASSDGTRPKKTHDRRAAEATISCRHLPQINNPTVAARIAAIIICDEATIFFFPLSESGINVLKQYGHSIEHCFMKREIHAFKRNRGKIALSPVPILSIS